MFLNKIIRNTFRALTHRIRHLLWFFLHLSVRFGWWSQLVNATLYSKIGIEGVIDMAYRTRIKYTPAEKNYMWDRWLKGDSLKDIGRAFDRGSSSIYGILSPTGGIRPPDRKRSRLAHTLGEREEISRGIVGGLSIRQIALKLDRPPSTISREIKRNEGTKQYRAASADQAAWHRSKRPKLCKLARSRTLRLNVAKKLKEHWSPQQIAGWLRRE